MGMAMVRRRIAGYAKVTRKPRAPLPKRKKDDELVGEQARPSAPMAAFNPRKAQPKTWWQKALKPAAIALTLLLGAGLAYLVLKSPARPAYDYSADTAQYPRTPSSAAMSAAARRSGHTFGTSSSEGGTDGVVVSNRSTPTDDSFRASGYVRKKVLLPNISGECVVKGNGTRDIGDCLRRQEEPQ